MYPAVLILHSFLRWIVLALGLLATASAFGRGDPPRRRIVAYVAALDLQLLVGASLWLFLSPLTHGLDAAALHDRELRFFAVEHPAMAVAAVALAHVGSVLLRRGRRRPGAVLVAASLIAAIAAVPWDRPLLRL